MTVGDNLDYRILRARHYAIDGKPEDEAWVVTLDSLKASLGEDELSAVAAYNCIVVYNNPSNLTWVQLDEFGNLLNITKDIDHLLINPGKDAPGYLDAWNRRH